MLTLNFTPFPLINTEKLLLRKITSDDVNEIFFLRSDKKVLKYLDKPEAKSIEEALDWMQKIDTSEKANEVITWAITLKNTTTLIGTICFWNIIKEHYRAEIGFVLHPNLQGKGIMQEAMYEVIKFGFEKMKLHSIEANVNPENLSSRKLLERNGFIKEAYFKENYYHDGKFLDSVIYSLLTPLPANNLSGR